MSEYNHPFKTINVPRCSTPQEVTTLKEQSRTDFINYINNYFLNKGFCINIEHKSNLLCVYFKSILNSEYTNELATAIAELCVSSKEDKDSFIKEVMDSSFLSSISLKGRNNVTYAPLTNHLSTKFYRHIIQIILSIGKRKYTSIVKNYSSIVKCEHGNLDKQCNKKDMQVLKLDCK